MRKVKGRMGVLLLSSCLLAISLIVSSCSVPNLETPQCTAARNSVKRFYSLHFANEAGPSEEYQRARKEFLTDRLTEALSSSEEGAKDYFTQTADFPKAFRVGGCTEGSNETAVLEVILLWRDDTRNEQADVRVRTVKMGERWRIDSVEN